MTYGKWFVSTFFFTWLSSLYGQSLTPPPSPFGNSCDENLSLFNTTQTSYMELPTFTQSISPLFGVTTMKSIVEANSTTTMNLHVRTGVNIPLSKNTKVQIWYQREVGDLELHNNQFKANDTLNPAQHYLIKFFYQF